MEKINHWCIICGKGYYACDSCDEIKSFRPWRKTADSIEHYQIYMILIQYRDGLISKEEALALLGDFDLSEKRKWEKTALVILDEILKDDESSKNNEKAKQKVYQKKNKI